MLLCFNQWLGQLWTNCGV